MRAIWSYMSLEKYGNTSFWWWLGIFRLSFEVHSRSGMSLMTTWYDSKRWYIRKNRHFLRPNELVEVAFGIARFCIFWEREKGWNK